MAARKQKLWDAVKTGQRVAIDIHYQDQMNGVVLSLLFRHAQEQYSVVRQLGLCHKANKDANTHLSIHVCGAVSSSLSLHAQTPETTPAIQSFGAAKWPMTFHAEDLKNVFPREDIVYFSPDATEPCDTIDPSKVYVIGGLVDRSIAKVSSPARLEA